MDFQLSDIHDGLATSVDALLTKADVPAAARAWRGGEHEPVRQIYRRLAATGATGLLIDEAVGGSGAGAMEMVVVAEQIGRHALPGPVAETLAVVPALLAGSDETAALRAIAEGVPITCAAPPLVPYAADADEAPVFLAEADGTVSRGRVSIGESRASVDPTRRLSEVTADETVVTGVDVRAATDLGALATAAELLGMGAAMVDLAAEYACARTQFGKPIGSFQAVKHHLADAAIAVAMARPLVWAAALGLDGEVPEGTDVRRDISAAKVAAGDAAYLASRKGLQVLGGIGYTTEHDLSRYLLRTRALVTAWGTPAQHRAAILETL